MTPSGQDGRVEEARVRGKAFGREANDDGYGCRSDQEGH